MQICGRQNTPRLNEPVEGSEAQVSCDNVVAHKVPEPQADTQNNGHIGDQRGLSADPHIPDLTRPSRSGTTKEVASASARAIHTDRTNFRGDNTLGAHRSITAFAIVDAAHTRVARAFWCGVGIRTPPIERLRHSFLSVSRRYRSRRSRHLQPDGHRDRCGSWQSRQQRAWTRRQSLHRRWCGCPAATGSGRR